MTDATERARLVEALEACIHTLKDARDHLTPRDAAGDLGDDIERSREYARAFLASLTDAKPEVVDQLRCDLQRVRDNEMRTVEALLAAEAALTTAREQAYRECADEVERLRAAALAAHDTLIELNENNYTHDEVCEANAAAVEAIFLLAEVLGKTHGKSADWWAARLAANAIRAADRRGS
jgi:hypothetical protein